jgi:hypothetical protein
MPRSTVSPASSAISRVRSIGNPYVSCRRNASEPAIVVPPACFVCATDRSSVVVPAARVRRNVSSSANA